MFKNLVEDRRKGSRHTDENAVLAACVYIACRLEHEPHSVKEISSVANVASIGGAMQYEMRQVKVEKDRIVRAGDFVERFCKNLGMTNQSVKAAKEAVEKCKEFDIRRSPVSIAAAVVYIVTQLSDDKKSLNDVLRETGVTERTIKSSYKDIYPHLVKIIPSWFAQEEHLKNLKC